MNNKIGVIGMPTGGVVASAYRPDIDGLRAWAILSVLLFHAFPNLLPGGFVGVDIFFVISGFLISRIVLSGLRRQQFSFLDFYIHRIRRIFPALLTVMLASLAFGWFALVAEEYRLLGKHVAGGIAFVDNVLLWGEDNYFGTASELKPLMHLWSLGVEEQFYLVFPVLLVMLWRWHVNLWWAVMLVAILSFGFNLHQVRSDSAAAFFLPHTRFWELLAGTFLAQREIFSVGREVSVSGNIRPLKPLLDPQVRGVVGISLIVLAFFSINKGSAFPGRMALLPVLGAAFVISAGPTTWVGRVFFANRFMVAVGLISYPLYLWHWPILSFLRILEAQTPAVAIRLAALFLTFLLAYLTYLIIEKPLRFGRAAATKAFVLFVVGSLIGVVGFWIYASAGFPQRAVEQDFGSLQRKIGHREYQAEIGKFPPCALSGYTGKAPCLIAGSLDHTPAVAIVGDSHGADIFLGLSSQSYDNRGVAYFSVVCYPFIGISGDESCNVVPPVMDYLLANDRVKTVILANYWVMRIANKTIRFQSEPENEDRLDVFAKLLDLTLKKLTAAGKEVIVAIDVPELDFPPAACLPSRPMSLTKRLPDENCTIVRDAAESSAKLYIAQMRRVLASYPNVQVWNPYDYLCNEKECLVARQGLLLFRDENHLTPAGTRWLFQTYWTETFSE